MAEMTEEEFEKLIRTRDATTALYALAAMPYDARRSLAKTALKFFRESDRVFFDAKSDGGPDFKDIETPSIGLFATATASELTKLTWFPRLRNVTMEEIVAALRPDWTQKIVDHFIGQNPVNIGTFAPLWEAGLCERPDSDALILGYYSIWGTRGLDDASLLAGDVWRFFEVEGGGEYSLANHDKFVKSDRASWSDRLIALSASGALDRQRLLDASLDALERDFGQYAAGWYSRFHAALEPNADELEARKARYLRLLGSAVPPTVSFAMKNVQTLQKAGAYPPDMLLDALDPALQARAKGTVKAALKLTESAAKKEPSLARRAAEKASLALVPEDSDVQRTALDLIARLDVDAASLREMLGDYAALVQPSVRGAMAELIGEVPSEPAISLAAVPRIEAQPVIPASGPDEALALVLAALETPRDPFDVERAVDAISRFGPALRSDEAALSPLRKRAAQLAGADGGADVRAVLAITGRSLAEGRPVAEVSDGKVPDEGLMQSVHLKRNAEVMDRVLAGQALPLLSLPSDTSGTVTAEELAERLARYKEAGVATGTVDLSLALLRLDPEGREIGGVGEDTEADRALAYALGREVEVGPTPEIWAAAWKARGGTEDDPAIAALFGRAAPECGVRPEMTLKVEREESKSGEFHWIKVMVPVTPPLGTGITAMPALFCRSHKSYYESVAAGFSYPDIAWAALVCPPDPEPFFRNALLHQDTWQKLADNHTRAYLEPFFRPGPAVGPLGAAVLVYYMACEDKSVSTLAAEAAVVSAADGRLSVDRFTEALRAFVLPQALPTARWTKAFLAMVEQGAGGVVRETIGQFLDFPPEKTPAGIGGWLELLYELHVAEGTVPERSETLACLEGLPGGGKVATYRKRLLALAGR